MGAVPLRTLRKVPEPDRTCLSVRGLAIGFRSGGAWRDVVQGLGFDLASRETLALVGESGSGKSVTALAIMGLLPPVYARCAGEVRFDGRDLLSATPEAMRAVRGDRIAMIFQEPMTSLNPVLTVGYQIAEALRFHRGVAGTKARRRAIELLDRVRIPRAAARFDEYPHSLSGGMRQRAMIAMALACEPALLIADEPTTALDVTVQRQILDLLQALQAELGMSMLFITHDMGVVSDVADRVLVMRHGVKQEEGAVAEVFQHPRTPYARELLDAVPRLGSLRGAAQPLKSAELTTGIPAIVAAPSPVPLLSVSGLTTRFGGARSLFGGGRAAVHAVEDVSFTLGRGETLALVGESGCGKSTTGRSILRLVEPGAGTVRFDGEDVLAARGADLRRLRRDIQMVFQDPYASLNPRQLVGDAIAEPLLVHGVCDRDTADGRVAELLGRVGLEPSAADRFPHEFSGGQRQRLCIARALGLSPKLVIADEAVSALDVSIKAQVIDLMIDLQRALGLSYLFISHDIAVVERVSHRVAVMFRGRIVEIGPRDAVINAPQHPYTRRLMAAVPLIDPQARRPAAAAAPAMNEQDMETGSVATRLVEVGPEHFSRMPV
ncbi:MAG: ABC transporter ATP-binding protein [Alphaproteobacteria bacterium]|nr:ABC transporter ATP-binding protein [Alphaproteobacteria bacterium]